MFAWLQPLWSRRRAAALIGAAGVSAAAAAFLPPVGAAAVVAVAVLCCGLAVGAPPDPRDHALRRHLAICRRREERAFVLVASAAGRRHAMTADLRISDSSVAASQRGDSTLVAVVDAREHARERITERLRTAHGHELRVGWATFPDDGLTLDALVDLASARAGRMSGGPHAAAGRSAGRSP
ncbi:MAG: hypothetical protein QOJ85_130 [Solirubrobacteraceae bacterium]|jgi:hypothetical protein|nr:hypothetical protein [Solirubrobacteraceae bacterium]